ncbi:MAG TPA: methylated-DNA--[protein]-cysteine S-methyltransferase [Burkholderiaceae bacterium]|nr:methylated-DNA--[protein]-cysteine S-methyltransferase [Burkholderiaceae bacterium]
MLNTSSHAHYFAVATAIRYLQAHAGEQPALAEVARATGLGESTLQRSFSAFAGVSPKRFLQYLTKEHARRLLMEATDVLSTTFATGLSSPGRLHDLLVTCEAMTPGEVGQGGDGVPLRYAFVDTPFGRGLAAATPRGLAYFGFLEDHEDEVAGLASLAARWPNAERTYDAGIRARFEPALATLDGRRPLHLVLRGTNFQIKVWEALLAIPEGRLVSYSQLAAAIGCPTAVRAVAAAVGRNPISVLIPCHRVIRESGELGGYHWGLPRKAALIAREAARREAVA